MNNNENTWRTTMSNFDKDKRDSWIDKLAFVLMFLVILGHSQSKYISIWLARPEWLMNFVYSFHMPAFVLISGLLTHKSEKVPWIRVKNLFAVYWIMSFFFYLPANYYINPISTRVLEVFTKPQHALWYLTSLITWLILTPKYSSVIKTIFGEKNQAKAEIGVSIIIGFVGGISTGLENTFVFYKTMVFFPFFVVGLNSNISQFKAFVKKGGLRKKLYSLVVLTLGVVLFYNFAQTRESFLAFAIKPYLYTTGLPLIAGTTNLQILKIGLLSRGIFYLLAIVFGLAIFALVPTGPIKKLESLTGKMSQMGSRRLYPYVHHYWFLIFLGPIINQVIGVDKLLAPLVLTYGSEPVKLVGSISVAFVTTLLLANKWTVRLLQPLTEPQQFFNPKNTYPPNEGK